MEKDVSRMTVHLLSAKKRLLQDARRMITFSDEFNALVFAPGPVRPSETPAYPYIFALEAKPQAIAKLDDHLHLGSKIAGFLRLRNLHTHRSDKIKGYIDPDNSFTDRLIVGEMG